MQGTYRIYEDGKLIAEQSNLITTEGKRAILRYLAGHTGSLARSLAVGTGTAPAALTDTRLGFEVARANINVVSPDQLNQSIVFKGTLPQNSHFGISEIGALTITEQDQFGQMLLTFDSASEPWTGTGISFRTSNVNRIGGDSLTLTGAPSSVITGTLTGMSLDLSQYSDADKFSLAYIPGDASLASLQVRFHTDASNYFNYSVSSLTNTGYKVESWARSQFVATGTPSWGNITYATVISTAKSTGATYVDLDGLRIDPQYYADTEYALVSRTVLGSPVIKTSTSQMDIEYTLDVTI